jgi:SAM-dependent methyltransferase
MKQNKYDDPEFFARYSEMGRSVGGLEAAGEWHAFRALLPDLRGKRVLDLGCGFGWHCRYAREQGARSVVGIDLSEKMLARAQALTNDSGIEYCRTAIEDLDVQPGEFDVVLSSLALHYVKRLERVCEKIHHGLADGGAFVLSVEHPIFTAVAAQQWVSGPAGERLHWPLDNYGQEGVRHTSWLAEDVVKYHRTLATYLNTLIDAGFTLTRVVEPQPSPEMLHAQPDMQDECRRPMFLLLAASKALSP